MKNKEDAVLQQVGELVAQDNNIAVLWLYGSRAKGTEQASSDYDLAVAFNQFPEDDWQRRLQPELLCQNWQDELANTAISVVDINFIPLPLAFSIIQQGKVIFCRDAMRLIKEEGRISSMWDIDYGWHQQHYG
jgi:predicted nucleotidyltransferase